MSSTSDSIDSRGSREYQRGGRAREPRSPPPLSASAHLDSVRRTILPNTQTRAARPTSEPVVKPTPSESSQRRARTSVDYGENMDVKLQGGTEEKRRSQGSDIMYAVVKGVPAKPAIPKLVGASGSGTVVVPRSRPVSQPGSGHLHQAGNNSRRSSSRNESQEASVGRQENHLRGSRISSTTDSTINTSSTAVTRNIHSKPGSRDSNVSDSAKRESLQSFTSFTSTLDESIPDDSPGTFDERDGQEETSLLQKHDGDRRSAKDSKYDRKDVLKTKETEPWTNHSTTDKREVPQRYAGGTPLGTKKSESSPENSTMDSTDTLFQPTAPLIAYPALDAYLSSLKPAKFSEIPKSSSSSLTTLSDLNSSAPVAGSKSPAPKSNTSGTKPKKAPPPDPREGMFPPLSQVPIGVTLDELKVNVTKPPGFFDQELQNVLLSSAVDGIMSGESSNIGISWMRIEIIRDFLQFVALYLSVSGNTFVNQKYLYASVNIIPALLSLDLPRAFGYGMIFLFLFCIVAFAALYTFKIMTRTDPNDDIEVCL